MPESAKLNEKVSKMQKDIEEIRNALRDDFYEDVEKYQARLEKVLSKRKETPIVWLEIDGFRCTMEIEADLKSRGQEVPHSNAWRAFQDMRKAGIITKVGISGRSAIYDKKLWAKELELDDYVRERYDIK